MCKPDTCINRCILFSLKLFSIGSLCLLFSFSAKAQLPVNLKTFVARSVSLTQAEIFWTTEYEKNNLYFEIERSADGVNFIAAGKVPGKNQNGVLTDYTFYDNNAINGVSYYRLKQVDVNDSSIYSHVERVGNSVAVNAVYMYPNPAPGSCFKIDLAKKIPGNIDVQVFDLSGRLQLQQRFCNSNSLLIYHYLKAGIYNVTINSKELTVTKKLLIQ